MASSTPFDGTNFLTGAPDEDQPHGNDYLEHQSTRKSMEFVNNKEHTAIANDPSAADGGGEHKTGSAKIYHGDYSTASAGDNLPSLRPDGVTALDSSDAGRLAYDTDATYGKKYYRWDGSAWQQDLTSDDETTLVGKSWFLDEDDMSSDDATKVASQQSIKKYVDDQFDIVAALGDDSDGTYSFTGGLTIKWGKHSTSGVSIVTFASAFGNACFQVIAGIGTSTGDATSRSFSVSAYSISKTGFTMNIGGGQTPGRWIAIGY
jgi:hypothetical protein